MMEKFSMTALVEKLNAIGGTGKWLEREWRIRTRLNWHTKARSAVRHMAYGERKPSLQEAREIEIAHLKFCAETTEANREANARLYSEMRGAIAAMEQSDPEFYRPHIEALGELLLRDRHMAGESGMEG